MSLIVSVAFVQLLMAYLSIMWSYSKEKSSYFSLRRLHIDHLDLIGHRQMTVGGGPWSEQQQSLLIHIYPDKSWHFDLLDLLNIYPRFPPTCATLVWNIGLSNHQHHSKYVRNSFWSKSKILELHFAPPATYILTCKGMWGKLSEIWRTINWSPKPGWKPIGLIGARCEQFKCILSFFLHVFFIVF